MSRTATKEAKIFLKSVVEPATEKPKETARDFFEQIVVAIILAMLIRGFDAEAFVIPTGSMAPTLMGRHKEVICPNCGFTYAINASDDTEDFVESLKLSSLAEIRKAELAPDRLAVARQYSIDAARSRDPYAIREAAENLKKAEQDVQEAPATIKAARLEYERSRQGGLCVNCRFPSDAEDTVSFKGDRILVMKFPYELPFLPGSAGPRRWDVLVFHYPEKPETNYIKRLVGLAGDDLRINHGDIQVRPVGTAEPFQIQRKPLIHQRAMQMVVYDDHYRPKMLEGKPEWSRWNPLGTFQAGQAGRFDAAATGPDWSELRYRHILPDPEQQAALDGHNNLPRSPRPTLITDFYSYNTNVSTDFGDKWRQHFDKWLQPNWVGDLTVSCRVDVASIEPGGKLKLELIEAGISNRCVVDLLTGMATLYHGETKLGEAGTVLRGVGAHDVEFANVDDRLTLWIDGETPFDEGLTFDDGPLAPYVPNAKDLDPVGVGVLGAKAGVSDLVLKRDIYYTQNPSHPDYEIPGVYYGYDDLGSGIQTRITKMFDTRRVVRMFDFLADPAQFAALKDIATGKSYAIRPDHFMMMGDNSPRSSDSRVWDNRDHAWRENDRANWEVPRSMLIGKAFFVYWPHGKPFGPDLRLSRDFRVPFRPYVERMKWIR